MEIINRLYLAVSIVTVINAITSLFWYWPKKTTTLANSLDAEKSTNAWTWKDTVDLILIIIALILLIGAVIYFNSKYVSVIFWFIILLSYYLEIVARMFPSAKILGCIVKGDKAGDLERREDIAILTLALVVGYSNILKVPDKIQIFARTLTNAIIADWVLIGFYVLSIFICVFFCCALSIIPLKLMILYFRKVCGRIKRQSISNFFIKIGRFSGSSYSRRNRFVLLLEYSFSQKQIYKYLLWMLLLPVLLIDMVGIIVDFVIKLVASIIWSLYLIIMHLGGFLAKVADWLTVIESRSAVAISFRIAIVLGFGFTVIINRYEPFLRVQQEGTAVLEFISSSIIIPIIIEWIIAYKRNSEKQEQA